jgi:hypothetical protein
MKHLVACLALVTAACGGKEPPASPTVTRKFADPGPGVAVLKAKEMGPGEEVVVEGRVSNVVTGIEAYNLVDDDLYYCGRGGAEDDCKTPWDYCCVDASTRADATITVERRDAGGKVAAKAPPDAAPELRLLDLVRVKGRIEKDEHGNVTIVETARYIHERPDLPDGLHWPK